MSEVKVVVTKKYLEELEDANEQLKYLEAMGVDNWEGYRHYSYDKEYCKDYNLEYKGESE